ncbi:MAG: hypothetical protein QM736_26105 [Vicinamibacterales bacterium]
MRRADRESAGFEHNFQSLRVVDVLEERYAAFDGLNLTFETREGILNHCSRRRAEMLERAEPHGVGRRFLDGMRPSLESAGLRHRRRARLQRARHRRRCAVRSDRARTAA